MPGDDVVANPQLNATRAITIAASLSQVFPWLAQMGFGKAGWYSYDWVDNRGKESARTLNDDWQVDRVGDVVPGGPIDFTVSVLEPNRAFCIVVEKKLLVFSLSFVLNEEMGGTRLVSRARASARGVVGEAFVRWLLGPGDGLMVRRQLLGVKERAEALATERSV